MGWVIEAVKSWTQCYLLSHDVHQPVTCSSHASKANILSKSFKSQLIDSPSPYPFSLTHTYHYTTLQLHYNTPNTRLKEKKLSPSSMHICLEASKQASTKRRSENAKDRITTGRVKWSKNKMKKKTMDNKHIGSVNGIQREETKKKRPSATPPTSRAAQPIRTDTPLPPPLRTLLQVMHYM